MTVHSSGRSKCRSFVACRVYGFVTRQSSNLGPPTHRAATFYLVDVRRDTAAAGTTAHTTAFDDVASAVSAERIPRML